MPYVRGFLNIVEGGGGGEIDNSLPGSQPGIDNTLPPPPPGIWPPPSLGNPIVPVLPDNSLPVQPGTIWPSPGRPPHVGGGPMPGRPPRPDQGLPGSQPGPDQGLPGQPTYPDQGLPGGSGGEITNPIQPKTYWMLCYTPNHGWKYVAVDPSLEVGMPLPPHAEPR